MICRTVAEVIAAAGDDARTDPPLSQDLADYVAAVFASRQLAKAAA